jgi:hypothetical protein
VTDDVPGDSWEERMAARTAQRRVVAEAERIAADGVHEAEAERRLTDLVGRDGWVWLNGWPRTGASVLIGTCVHCVGCGRYFGIATVVFEEGWRAPGPAPAWPFLPDTCPICRAPEEP